MKEDFVLVEYEMAIAVNKITNTIDFLSRSIDSYIKILSDVQKKGIEDRMICSELSDLAERVRNKQESLEILYNELGKEVNSGIRDVETNDNFEFPSDFMTNVISLLSMFL